MTRRLLSVAALIIFVFSPIATLAGQKIISECGTIISEPGNYKLTQDLLACPGAPFNTIGGPLAIVSSDVKLNLKGNTIECQTFDEDYVYGYGVFVGFGLSDVHIRNGTIKGCNAGVFMGYLSNSSITNLTVVDSKVESFYDEATETWVSFGGLGLWILGGNDTVTKHNTLIGNETAGIYDEVGIGSKISHNVAHGNGDQGIWIDTAQHSKVLCNNVRDNPLAGILLSGNTSTGNLIKGNVVSGAFGGIAMLAFATNDMPFGNTFRGNRSEGNLYDVSEALFTGTDFVVEDGAACQNSWKKNQFGSQVGPLDCIGPPVELDDDDICALDNDDDD